MNNDLILKSKQKLNEICTELELDAIVIPDGDYFLNEYTPEDQSLRKRWTGFSGSVAQSFYLSNISGLNKEHLALIVDGRYETQASNEFKGDKLNVVNFSNLIFDNMVQSFDKAKVKKLGLFYDRTSLKDFEYLRELYEVVDLSSFVGSRYESLICQNVMTTKPVTYNPDQDAILISNQADMNSRLLGLRTDAQKNMASLPGVLFYTPSKQLLFTYLSEIQKVPLAGLEVISINEFSNSENFNADIIAKYFEIDHKESARVSNKLTFTYDTVATNAFIINLLQVSFPTASFKGVLDLNTDWMTIKTESELHGFRLSFGKSEQAIWKTLKYCKEHPTLSEQELKEKIISEYKAEGAWNLSFSPICAIGEHSAIIHYGKTDNSKCWQEGEFLLLDSGAYYEPGVATDITRTLYSGKPGKNEILKYSLVLKGLVQAQMAIFTSDTLGSAIDMLARAPLMSAGLNYLHGTGHGIGVHVHESGYLLNPLSHIPMRAGQVGSIEPGYYEPGVGGIRLENAVIVKNHPKYKNMLCFEPLNYIPFEESLIDRDLFSKDQLEYLDDYQRISYERLK